MSLTVLNVPSKQLYMTRGPSKIDTLHYRTIHLHPVTPRDHGSYTIG